MYPAGISQIHRVLIVGDSRIRGMGYYLNNTSLNLEFTVQCLPGARIEEIGVKIMTCLAYNDDFDLVLHIGGINDVTKLKFRPSRYATLRYSSGPKTCEEVMLRLYRVREKIANIYGIPMCIATIPGMNLINYSPMMWYRVLPLQETLDLSMFEINRRIRGLNRRYGHSTLNVAYPVHRCGGRGGRYHSHYGWLVDGLHPKQSLMERWANDITNFCAGNLSNVQHLQDWI